MFDTSTGSARCSLGVGDEFHSTWPGALSCTPLLIAQVHRNRRVAWRPLWDVFLLVACGFCKGMHLPLRKVASTTAHTTLTTIYAN